MEEQPDTAMTQKLPNVRRDKTVPETPLPMATSNGTQLSHVRYKRTALPYIRLIPKNDAARVHQLEEQCRRFCLSLFFREHAPARSLGVTSSVPGEGKSFISIMLGHILANDSLQPVTLIECDWENPSLHDYFGFPIAPGLAEYLRGECAGADILHRVNDNFYVIRAGDGQQDAVRLLQLLAKRGLHETLSHKDHLLLLDLPPVTTSSYSLLAASLVEAVVLVVQAGFAPDQLVAEACAYLNDLPMQGIILNQINYKPGAKQ